jgi:hypothetical protein
MSDSIRIVEKTADRLAVLIPPFHSFAYALFLAAALALVLAVTLRRAPSGTRLFIGVACLILLVWAFYMNTSSILIVLSRQQDAFLIEHRAFGFEMSRKSYPLDDVVSFGLYSQRPYRGNDLSHDISVELKSGEEFGVVGSNTNQAGYDAAVDALNDFLRE